MFIFEILWSRLGSAWFLGTTEFKFSISFLIASVHFVVFVYLYILYTIYYVLKSVWRSFRVFWLTYTYPLSNVITVKRMFFDLPLKLVILLKVEIWILIEKWEQFISFIYNLMEDIRFIYFVFKEFTVIQSFLMLTFKETISFWMSF